MSYSKEQFIEDFKNAYNQSQQLHYMYRYVSNLEEEIKSFDINDVTIYFSENNIQLSIDTSKGVKESNIIDIKDYTLYNDISLLTNKVNNIISGREHLYSNITDENSIQRFTSENIVSNNVTGVSVLRSKWSLSGNIFKIDLMFSTLANITASSDTIFLEFTVPTFIYERLLVTYAGNIIECNSFNGYTNTINPSALNPLYFKLMKVDGRILLKLCRNATFSSSSYHVTFSYIIDGRDE